MSRVIIVGEAPNTGVLPNREEDVLAGAIGKRLAAWAGISFEDYLARTTRVNLFDSKPKHWGKIRARRAADAIADELVGSDSVILLGSRVAEAFGLVDLPLYTWQAGYYRGSIHGPTFVRLPHPSGLNRVLNDSRQRTLASMVMSEAMRLAR